MTSAFEPHRSSVKNHRERAEHEGERQPREGSAPPGPRTMMRRTSSLVTSAAPPPRAAGHGSERTARPRESAGSHSARPGRRGAPPPPGKRGLVGPAAGFQAEVEVSPAGEGTRAPQRARCKPGEQDAEHRDGPGWYRTSTRRAPRRGRRAYRNVDVHVGADVEEVGADQQEVRAEQQAGRARAPRPWAHRRCSDTTTS